ncbi:hypothetical protein ACJRO7_016300 [Eucalyptus globulus]|uniref:non-specific serine/threonine protein kinase n=1 Tax=Eucalyptus globulus TaxID=34317 RepID=A0ABD3L6X6_EUCGL
MASPVPPASSRSPMPISPASPSCRYPLLTGLVVGLCVGAVVGVVLFACYRKKNRQPRAPTPSVPTPSAPQSYGKRIFTLPEVKRSTNFFSDNKVIGEGGFGHVYKGDLTGKDVAVKRLKGRAGGRDPGFETEVENLSRAHHKHVVSLVGYCIAGAERILVYEYVPNGSLESHLRGDEQPTLDWPKRLKITLGSAKGLAYLHGDCYPKIIHRDIKAANILVDSKFEAKIADFGLAKCISESRTHVSTAVKGSTGYLAPEYVSCGQLTEKSDMYSFGVVLLELITGRKASDATDSPENRKGLVDWVRPQVPRYLKDGNFSALVDPSLQNHYKPDEMARMVQCAVACVYKSADDRPKMSEIVRALEGCLRLSFSPSDLNPGEMPGLSSLLSGCKSSGCGTSQGLEMSRKTPLAIPEHGSGHHNKPTSGSRRAGPSRPTAQGVEMRKM